MSDFLDLELHVVVNCRVNAENGTQVLRKGNKCFNCYAVIVAPKSSLKCIKSLLSPNLHVM